MANKAGLRIAVIIIVMTVLAMVAGFLGLSKPQNNQASIKFMGEIRRGQFFEHAISGDLVFKLEPLSHPDASPVNGWSLQVFDKSKPDNNYAAVATTPLHSNDIIYIGSYSSSPEDAVSVNPREFYFVQNETDYQAAFSAFADMSHYINDNTPDGRAKFEEASAKWGAIKKGSGAFNITDSKLGDKSIEELKFSVWLKLD